MMIEVSSPPEYASATFFTFSFISFLSMCVMGARCNLLGLFVLRAAYGLRGFDLLSAEHFFERHEKLIQRRPRDDVRREESQNALARGPHDESLLQKSAGNRTGGPIQLDPPDHSDTANCHDGGQT